MNATAQQAADPRQELLAQMHDLAAPASSHFWPPAPLWWLLAITLIGLLVWGLFSLRQRLQQTRYRRIALKEYRALMQQRNLNSDAWLCQQLSRLLKRTFFNAYPNSRRLVAGLYGRDWLALLELTAKHPLHAQQYEKTLTQLLYANNANENDKLLIDDFARFTETWIKQHKRRSTALRQSLTEKLKQLKPSTPNQPIPEPAATTTPATTTTGRPDV